MAQCCPPAAVVRLFGLARRTELNGLFGLATKYVEDRYIVVLDDTGEIVKARPANLEFLTVDSEDERDPNAVEFSSAIDCAPSVANPPPSYGGATVASSSALDCDPWADATVPCGDVRLGGRWRCGTRRFRCHTR